MHSLFSESFSREEALQSEASVVAAAGTEEKSSSVHIPSHDPDAWKNPSFMSKDKGKGKARAVDEGPQSRQVSKKRQRSVQPTPPAAKRAKVTEADDTRGEIVLEESESRGRNSSGGMIVGVLSQASAWLFGRTHAQTTDEPAAEAKMQPRDGHATFPTFSQGTTETPSQSQHRSKGRLANFRVDFENVDLGKEILMPRLDWKRDVQNVLLRTGRIRTLGEQVERDGSVYINQE
jgi:hypothetical protein